MGIFRVPGSVVLAVILLKKLPQVGSASLAVCSVKDVVQYSLIIQDEICFVPLLVKRLERCDTVFNDSSQTGILNTDRGSCRVHVPEHSTLGDGHWPSNRKRMLDSAGNPARFIRVIEKSVQSVTCQEIQQLT